MPVTTNVPKQISTEETLKNVFGSKSVTFTDSDLKRRHKLENRNRANLEKKKTSMQKTNSQAAALETQLQAQKFQQLNVYLTGLHTQELNNDNDPTILTRFITPLLATAPKVENFLPEEEKTPKPEMTLRDVRTLRVKERTQGTYTKYIQGKYITRHPSDTEFKILPDDEHSKRDLNNANILIYFTDIDTINSLKRNPSVDIAQELVRDTRINEIKKTFTSLQQKPKVIFFLLEEPYRKDREKKEAREKLESFAEKIFSDEPSKNYQVAEYQFPDNHYDMNSVINKEGHRQHFKAFYDAIESEERKLLNDKLQTRLQLIEQELMSLNLKDNANIGSIQEILKNIALIQDVELLDKVLSLFETFQKELKEKPKSQISILNQYQEVAFETLKYLRCMRVCNFQNININDSSIEIAKRPTQAKSQLTKEQAIQLSDTYYEKCTKISPLRQFVNGVLAVVSVVLGAVLGCVAGTLAGAGMGSGVGAVTGGVHIPVTAVVGGAVGAVGGAVAGGIAGYRLFLGNHGLGFFRPKEFYNEEVKSIRDYGIKHADKLKSEKPEHNSFIATIDSWLKPLGL